MVSGSPTDPRDQLAHDIESKTALPPSTSAEAAAEAVMCVLVERLTAGEAHDVLEALPEPLRPLLAQCVAHRRRRPVERFDDADFLQRVADHLDLTPAHAEAIAAAVFASIRAQIPAAVARHVANQLPSGVKELWLGERRPAEGSELPDDVRRMLLAEIEARAALPLGTSAADALAAAMCIFSQRLSGGEARDLFECLPTSIRPLVDRCMLHRAEAPSLFGRPQLLRRLGDHLGVSEAQAEQVARVVLAAVRATLPPSEAEAAGSQLPVDLRDLWEPS